MRDARSMPAKVRLKEPGGRWLGLKPPVDTHEPSLAYRSEQGTMYLLAPWADRAPDAEALRRSAARLGPHARPEV